MKIKNPFRRSETTRLIAESGPSNDVFVNENTIVVHLLPETLRLLADDPTVVWVHETVEGVATIVVKAESPE